MSDRMSSVILLMLAAAVVLGALLGHFAPQAMQDAGFIGRLSLDFLYVLVIPLVVASIVVASATGKRSFPQGKVLGNAFALFASITLIAIVIALALGLVFQPGAGVDLTGESLPDYMSPQRSPGVPMLLERIFPGSFAQLFTPEHLLGLILFSLFFGLTLRRLGRRARAINDFMRGLRDALQRLVGAYLWVLPVGLLFLVGSASAEVGFTERLATKLGAFTLALLIGLVIQGAVVLPLIAAFVGRTNPWHLFRDILPALTTALGTGSATATLPVTQRYAMDEAGIERNTGSLVLPLGALLNVCGTAMFVALGAMFVMQSANVGISVVSMLLITAVALFVPVGLVGVPRGALLVLMIALQVVDLPLAGYVGLGLLAAFAWLFERFQTVVDVWADVVTAATVAHLTGTEHQVPRSRDKKTQTGEDYRERRRPDRGGRDQQRDSRSRTRPDRPDRPGRTRGRRDDRRGPDSESRQRPERQETQSKSPFSVPMSERRKDYLDVRQAQSKEPAAEDKPASSRPVPSERPSSDRQPSDRQPSDRQSRSSESRGRSRGRTDDRPDNRPDRRRNDRRGQQEPASESGRSNGRSQSDQERRQTRDRRRSDNQPERNERRTESTKAPEPKPESRPETKPGPKPNGRKSSRTPSETPEPATARSKGRLVDLTDEAIERERARVNAQLAAMRAMLDSRQESDDQGDEQPSTTASADQDRERQTAQAPEKTRIDQPQQEPPEQERETDIQVDYAESSSARPETTKELTDDDEPDEMADTAQAPDEQPSEPSFGRSRGRRGPSRRDRTASPPEPVGPEVEDSEEKPEDAHQHRPPADSLASRLAVKIAQSAEEAEEPGRDEPDDEIDQDDDSARSEQELSFGRRPSRRGKGLRARPSGSAESSDEPSETDDADTGEQPDADESETEANAEPIGSSFDKDSQAFGRGKRRK